MRIREWKGLLSDETRSFWRVTNLLLVITAAALSFMQLGFVGIGYDGEYLCYMMVMLVPIALATLLFGKWVGAGIGLFAGTIQYAHAVSQPMDVYERYFVTPLSSIVLYAFMGFFFGLAFAIALHNEPRKVRRAIYIGLVCYVGSVIATLMFTFNTLMATMLSIVFDPQQESVAIETIKAMAGLGSMNLQVNLDFLLLLVITLVTDYLMRHYERVRGHLSLPNTFRGWLLAVVYVAFMLVCSVGFVVITRSAEQGAKEQMDAEIVYLLDQIRVRENNADRIATTKEFADLSIQTARTLMDTVTLDSLLDGYSLEEDGVVVFFEYNDDGELCVRKSDTPAYREGLTVSELFGSDGQEIFDSLAQTGQMRQTLYNVGSEGDLQFVIDASSEEGLNVTSGTVAKHEVESLREDADSHTLSSQLGYMRVAKNDTGIYYLMMMLPSSKVFAGRSRTIAWMSLSTIALLLVVYALITKLIRYFVVGPIDQTNAALARITSGDLEAQVQTRQTIEFATLSDDINMTVGTLKSWIAEANTRMERELATAKTIQESALPRTFPPFPEVEAFDIYASMNAAKEVGGDFYDFFLIDDHTLGFLIADVSGKGIPGALFMMAAKRELGNAMQTGMSIVDAVLLANKRLCEGNDAGMFVTVWAATLDYNTGEVTFVNAGHNFPLLRHGEGGSWEWIKQKGGLFLGTFETAKYRSAKLTLKPGDELLLYTDGVNEAFSVDGVEYGNDRLEAFLDAHTDMGPRRLVDALRTDVATWAEGAEQSDDITMLCLEFGVAPEASGSISVEATLENYAQVESMLIAELDRRMCPPSVRNKVLVALEELYVNVCRYAYEEQEAPGEVTVSYLYRGKPPTIAVKLRDNGMPFDPVSRTDPTIPRSIQEAKIGGLGIFMVKKSMDEFTYEREGDQNVVVFAKHW